MQSALKVLKGKVLQKKFGSPEALDYFEITILPGL
jgi:hypothetical protein